MTPLAKRELRKQLQTKAPEISPGLSSFVRARNYVLVRIRIMKLSKLSSATCIQASDSLR